MKLAVLVLLGACSSRTTTTTTTAPSPTGARSTSTGTSSSSTIRNTVPPDAPPWPAYPTQATAGARECKLEPSSVLGPLAEGGIALGFSAHGGIAAWTTAPRRLAVRRLDANGAPTGPASELAIPDETTPKHVVPLGDGFVVLAVRWAWQQKDVAWWGAYVDARTAHAAVDLALADMDVLDAQPLARTGDDRRIGLLVFEAAVAKRPQKPRWQTLEVDRTGAIRTTAHPLTFSIDEQWTRARRGEALGWRSQRGAALFDGKRVENARDALPLAPDDAVEARVTNLAQPIPRRGGVQYEARARPALVRERAGAAIGVATDLEEHGLGVGVIGFMMSGTLAWTGTRFVYAYRRDSSATIMPIDCR